MPCRSSDKPWFHSASGFFCATVNGKRQYLDRDYKAACRKLRRLRSEAQREAIYGRDWLDASLSELADEYLDDIRARRANGAYKNYRRGLLRLRYGSQFREYQRFRGQGGDSTSTSAFFRTVLGEMPDAASETPSG